VALLRAMPADSVHCCVTSPPYWGLRDYGTPPQIWGGDPECRHRWGAEGKSGQRLRNGEGSDTAKQAVAVTLHPSTGAFCQRCGAWRGSLGLEPTYQLYVDHLVEVLREVRRVLRPDGTLWLNLGDCYATGGGKAKKAGGGKQGAAWAGKGPSGYRGAHGADPKAPAADLAGFQPNRMPQPGLKPKDLVGIPWRVAFALQDEGWWLRRDHIWSKPNPMPESVRDRCTSAHEYLFHLTKSARYYYDGEAIKEPATNGELFHGGYDKRPGARTERNGRRPSVPKGGFGGKTAGSDKPAFRAVTETRNKRSVWTITTSPFPEAHFATFPPALVEPCILAGTSERGVCPHCGAPWMRMVKRVKHPTRDMEGQRAKNAANSGRTDGQVAGPEGMLDHVTTIGWRASCDCAAADPSGRDGIDRGDDKRGRKRRCGNSDTATAGWRSSCECSLEPVPATVLDPFLGAGTTALVADRLGRDCIGLELSPEYAAMARRRTRPPEPRLRRAA
jgi:DNA modification methylase